MKTHGKILLAFLLLVCTNLFAQVPVLSSHPSASSVIYIDFDGQYLTGSSWNMSGPLDLGPANLTTEKMSEIFNRVAEDYRPFNVNVTTDSTKYWSAPATQRMRIIATISSSWYGSAGGVSYMGSFTWGDNTPCFVFTALLNYNAKNIAEAASHEAGHTLGLRHQSAYDGNCVKTAEYNAGVGSGEIGWAPIMGVGYYRNFTLWNNGANPYGCSQIQDDLSVITSNNGFSYRTDDVGNATNSSTLMNFTNNMFSYSGIVERSTDLDVFKFIMPTAGNFKLNAIPFNIGAGNTAANLDLQVELLTKTGQLIATYNPENLLNTIIDTTLNANTYHIRISGKGNSYASEYASLGSYNIEARILSGGGSVLPVRKVQLSAREEQGKHKLNWEIDADEAVTSQTIEVSDNGSQFAPLTFVGPAYRSYTSSPSASGNRYYRILVGFANGQQHYTNIVMIRQNGAPVAGPRLQGNLVQYQLGVQAGEAFDYQVTDYNGRLVEKGRVSPGSSKIGTGSLAAGMYLIRFNNGKDQYTEKFMKQ
jgi:hypothetical protein